MFSQKEALAKLLRDEDPETLRLVKAQLVTSGEEGLEQLRELINTDDQIVSQHAREVFSEIRGRVTSEEFFLHCHFFSDKMDLEQVCWAMARAIESDVCTQASEKLVDKWGAKFQMRISGVSDGGRRVRLLAEFLSKELGFFGSSENYYCEKNSLLPRVIESREGIPITLTMLYMIIGARAAMKIEGINLPGHFIARYEDIFFDPFHNGRILTLRDIGEILQCQGLALQNCHLQPATPRQMLVRMLANLLYVYDLDENWEKREQVHSWMSALTRGQNLDDC